MRNKEIFHNPDKLTKKQVGTGYRLLYPHEITGKRRATKHIHCWDSYSQRWMTDVPWNGNHPNFTYRVSLTQAQTLNNP